FEEARTFLLKGQLERRAKQKAAARVSLEHAAELFGRLGADGWVAKAGAESRRLGLRRSREELSETERRVVELARVYRKLGVASRAELAFRIGSAGRSTE